MSYWGWRYPRYVSVAEKKEKAEKQIKKLIKKGERIEPVTVQGRKTARKWWGIAWNENLERYADYYNRIERGRSYVSNGLVLHLKMDKGKINSLVAGTRSKPYKVTIGIDTLSGKAWKKIVEETEGQIESIQSLLEGNFPREFQNMFMEKKSGLFPSPSQIHFDCSCPDWASMCKHVAATLYGTGARLDSRPELFFTLRGVNMEELAGRVIKKQTRKMLKKARKKSKRSLSMAKEDISALFGITMDDGAKEIARTKRPLRKAKKKISKKKGTRKKSAYKKSLKTKAAIKKTVKKKVIKKKAIKKIRKR
jgi:uncharacterized Zn finger protein